MGAGPPRNLSHGQRTSMFANRLNGSKSTPIIIGIAGGTGSGKTTVATRIVSKLPEGQAALIQHDWYYRDYSHLSVEERAKLNFDEPKALENELLIEHLQTLQNRGKVACPQYDFSCHTRIAETKVISPCRIIVVEGILTFSVTELRELFDLRVYVDTDDDIRLLRRIKRDILDRGRDVESIQRQYYETVRPMHRLHVEPYRELAHLIIPEGGRNRAAIDVIVSCLLYGMLP